MRSHGYAIALLASGACGRIHFDAREDATIVDASTSAFMRIALPDGGHFDRVKMSSDGGTWFALAHNAGAWRSTNAGASWVACEKRPGEAIVVDATNIVYLGGRDDVYVSKDACASWRATGLGVGANDLLATPKGIYAATPVGVRLFTTSWAVIPTPAEGREVFSLARNAAGAMVAGTGTGVIHSSDGDLWLSANTGGDVPGGDVTEVGIGVAGAATMAYASGNNIAGIYCSNNAGVTWVSCFSLPATSLLVSDTDPAGAVAGIFDDLVDTPSSFSTVATDLRTPNMHAGWVLDLAKRPNGDLLAAVYTGLFAAPSGTYTWQPAHTGIEAWSITRIVVDGNDVFLAGNMGALRSLDGAPFEVITTGMTQNTAVFSVWRLGGTVFAGGRHIRVSVDEGASWSEVYDTGPDNYAVYAFANIGTRVFATSKKRVLRSDPPYTTWTGTQVAGMDREIYDIRVRGNELWLGAQDGVFVSPDAGATFSRVAEVPVASTPRLSIAGDGSILAATANGLWLSNTGAAGWRVAFGGESIIDVIARGTQVVVIAGDSVQASLDGGTTWNEVPGLNARTPRALAFDADGSLLVGTSQNGFWRARPL